MKKLTSLSEQVLAGLILLFIAFLLGSIKDCFCKNNHNQDTKNVGTENNGASNPSNDSPAEVNIKLEQNNSTVYAPEIQSKFPQKTKQSKPEIYVKENNGFINFEKVENSPQTLIFETPKQRHLTNYQTSEILSLIPKGYDVEIRYPYPDQESDYFREQIVDLLEKSDRNPYWMKDSTIGSDTYKDYNIRQYPDKPNVMKLTIYRQKK